MVTMTLLVSLKVPTLQQIALLLYSAKPITKFRTRSSYLGDQSNYRGYFFQINDETPVETMFTPSTFTLPFTGTLNTLKIYSTNSIGTNQNYG